LSELAEREALVNEEGLIGGIEAEFVDEREGLASWKKCR
jgi:hypothetical protein